MIPSISNDMATTTRAQQPMLKNFEFTVLVKKEIWFRNNYIYQVETSETPVATSPSINNLITPGKSKAGGVRVDSEEIPPNISNVAAAIAEAKYDLRMRNIDVNEFNRRVEAAMTPFYREGKLVR